MDSHYIHSNKSAYTAICPIIAIVQFAFMQLALNDFVTLEDAIRALAEGTSSACSSRNHTIQVSFLSVQ